MSVNFGREQMLSVNRFRLPNAMSNNQTPSPVVPILENDFTWWSHGYINAMEFKRYAFFLLFLFQDLCSKINDLRKSLNLFEIIIIYMFNNIKCIYLLIIDMIVVFLVFFLFVYSLLVIFSFILFLCVLWSRSDTPYLKVL